jgi:hypothetical protein
MIELPQVTLVAIDGSPDPTRTERSLAVSAAQARFGRVLCLSLVPCSTPALLELGCEWRQIAPLDLTGYNRFCLAELHRYIDTTHCLSVQPDSRIVNADAWRDDWRQYDYIGAPWRVGHTGTPYRVGNSGFCLRSRALLEATASLPTDHYIWRGKVKRGCRDDVITCVMYREQLERQQLRFAPVDVAAQFAFEFPVPEAPALEGQFGVHEYRRRVDKHRSMAATGSSPPPSRQP